MYSVLEIDCAASEAIVELAFIGSLVVALQVMAVFMVIYVMRVVFTELW